jgi:leucyl aminopeptidase
MPLTNDYRKQIDSEIADLKNTGGRPGGSITAALFLSEFVTINRWIHLDIAGTALPASRDSGYLPSGMTGT